MDVMATTMMVIGDTMEASTADWPRTRAPTILMAVVAPTGLRMSLSLSISNIAVNMIISRNVGKGTPSLWTARDISSLSGIVFWSYVAIAIYIAGVKMVIIRAINLRILVKVVFTDNHKTVLLRNTQ